MHGKKKMFICYRIVINDGKRVISFKKIHFA